MMQHLNEYSNERKDFIQSIDKRSSIPVNFLFLSLFHFLCIPAKKDSFVNSQEWTLSRSVPELRLGIVGSINSGKSALVHRYLTGSYMQEESPEGGRFKKEIFIDNQSYLLLIRDEGGSPEMQVRNNQLFKQFALNYTAAAYRVIHIYIV